jgi:hypothetical protein
MVQDPSQSQSADLSAVTQATRVYGRWAGNPKGHPENITKCIESVMRSGRMIGCQCSRKRGFGPDGLYCRQHSKRYSQLTAPTDPRLIG